MALFGRLKLNIGVGSGSDVSQGNGMFMLRFNSFSSVMNSILDFWLGGTDGRDHGSGFHLSLTCCWDLCLGAEVSLCAVEYWAKGVSVLLLSIRDREGTDGASA